MPGSPGNGGRVRSHGPSARERLGAAGERAHSDRGRARRREGGRRRRALPHRRSWPDGRATLGRGRLDEGAWGKGYGLDRAAKTLAQAGVRSALLDLGGQVFAVGFDTGEKPWRVPVADPRDRDRTVVELGLADRSASTSGDSERFREVAGRRIGHILDPRTGEPAPDFGSVTVIAPTGLVADVLSTAFFVLGPEKGLALSETLRRRGVGRKSSSS